MTRKKRPGPLLDVPFSPRSYDALNRLLGEASAQGAVSYTYDATGRRLSMQASALAPVGYSYDAASRLTQITQAGQTVTSTYDAANRRTSVAYPNGTTSAYSFDAASQLIAQTFTGPSGQLGDLTYTHDPNGNRSATGGSWARTLLPTSVPTASYDPANRQLAFGTLIQTFDANGNLLTQSDMSGTMAYTWDTRSRLGGVTGPSVSASFAYDALGRRINKTINGQTTSVLYDGLDIVQEIGPSGPISYLRSLIIDEALTSTDPSGTVAYLTDVLGSAVALTDATGNVATSYSYAAFGDTSLSGSSSANPFQFTGRQNDLTGLYYHRARYYNPRSGRFINEDPIGLQGGINMYLYA